MGPSSPPAYLFVIRHGSRLDQADQSWHLSSTTPYDSPLTYNGWLQAQATGSHIASILRQAEKGSDSDTSPTSSKPPSKKKRNFNVVIHTSPFLRCVQTSVGISAGLSQPPPPSPAPSPGPDGHSPVFASSPSPTRSPTSAATPNNGIRKIPLRVDAFLGEWLNPEYFESITRPPSSANLISAAKVGLLRKETMSAYETATRPAGGASASQAHTHGRLWSSPKLNPNPAPERTGSVDSLSLGLDGMPAMASALPRERAGSSGSTSSLKAGTGTITPPIEGYIPPTPNYAISSSHKIPDGYVAHARDACSAVDYQWDSTMQWGDGGEFGEEWITMHRRFRKGFQHLIDWYAATEDPTKLVTQNAQATHKGETAHTEDDSETETVVIVVSHGAGCNAMIGAITRQPVLMDVGVATITMAVRKSDVNITGADALAKPTEVPIDQYYDLKMQASNAHLRGLNAGGSALARAASISSHSGHTPPPVHPRGRVSTMASYNLPSGGIFGDLGNPVTRSNSAAAQTGLPGRRTSHATSSLSKETPFVDTSKAVASSSFARKGPGLWEPSPVQRKEDDDDDDMFPDFDGTRRFGTSVDAIPAAAPAPEPVAAPLSTSPRFTPGEIKLSAYGASEENPAEDNKQPETSASGGLWGSTG